MLEMQDLMMKTRDFYSNIKNRHKRVFSISTYTKEHEFMIEYSQ